MSDRPYIVRVRDRFGIRDRHIWCPSATEARRRIVRTYLRGEWKWRARWEILSVRKR